MGEPALAAPVQVYVGLDSAPTVRERVDLALAEMERTGAFDRSLLVLVSPTGLGYVNYVALGGGPVPVPRRHRVGDDAVLAAALPALARPGGAGPRAEPPALAADHRADPADGGTPARGSCCSARASARTPARTSSCTGAPWACGPWASTGRCGSARPTAASGCTRSPARTASTSTGTASPWSTTSPSSAPSREERGSLPPYVLLSHDNDGVTRFGPDLLTTEPAWLGPAPAARRSASTAPARAASPVSLRWRPVTTFFQTLVDVKNAQVPGTYQAWGHDYRPDLPGSSARSTACPASTEQLARVTDGRPAARRGALAGVPGGLVVMPSQVVQPGDGCDLPDR